MQSFAFHTNLLIILTFLLANACQRSSQNKPITPQKGTAFYSYPSGLIEKYGDELKNAQHRVYCREPKASSYQVKALYGDGILTIQEQSLEGKECFLIVVSLRDGKTLFASEEWRRVGDKRIDFSVREVHQPADAASIDENKDSLEDFFDEDALKEETPKTDESKTTTDEDKSTPDTANNSSDLVSPPLIPSSTASSSSTSTSTGTSTSGTPNSNQVPILEEKEFLGEIPLLTPIEMTVYLIQSTKIRVKVVSNALDPMSCKLTLINTAGVNLRPHSAYQLEPFEVLQVPDQFTIKAISSLSEIKHITYSCSFPDILDRIEEGLLYSN